MRMPTHFSLNIKTLSAATNAMVLSIGICKFDEENILDKGYWALDTSYQKDRHVDTDRLHWWFRQHQSNKDLISFTDIVDDGIDGSFYPPSSALKMLNMFIHKHGSIPEHPEKPANFMWMRGINFDWAILEDMSHQGTGLIFQHNALRDQRTFCDEVIQHAPHKNRHALLDAVYHAEQVQAALKLKGKTQLK